MANWNAYDNARKRTMPPMGRKTITDADVIIAQEEEIERYRATIRNLEEKLREEKEPVLQLGDVITLKVNGNEYRYFIDNVEMMFDKLCVDTVTIKGHKVSV